MWTGALVTATAVWTIFRYGLHSHSDVIHGSGWALLVIWILWIFYNGGGGDGDSIEVAGEFFTCDHSE